jgi:PIN domain nuclease of toxin-antitoxin system
MNSLMPSREIDARSNHTRILLWALIAPDRLDIGSREILASSDHAVFFSAFNIWEMAIKRVLGRPDFNVEPYEVYCAARHTWFSEIPVSGVYASAVRHVPLHHCDPFDRLLINQAQTDPQQLMSDDPLISRYCVALVHPRAAP